MFSEYASASPGSLFRNANSWARTQAYGIRSSERQALRSVFPDARRSRWCTLRAENHCCRVKLCHSLCEGLIQNKRGRFCAHLKAPAILLCSPSWQKAPPTPHSRWVGGAQLRTDIPPSSCALSREPWDGPISVFGQKPSPWLPLRATSLALGIVKLLVGISKEPVLASDGHHQASFQRTSLIPKRHHCTVLRFLGTGGSQGGLCPCLFTFISSPLPISWEAIPL